MSKKIIIVSLASVAGVSALFWGYKYVYPRIFNRKKKVIRRDSEILAARWEKVGHVTKLWIYPVKSCAGVSCNSAIAEREGFVIGQTKDRCLMIIDSAGNMVTGRTIAATVLIYPDWKGDTLTLTFPHLQPLQLDLSYVDVEGAVLKAKVWDDSVFGMDCGEEVADWLSLALGKKCRLLYHSKLPSSRLTDKQAKFYPLMKINDNALYGDLAGYMLMSETSLADLQSRVEGPIMPQNFRPNILVGGLEKPYTEDDWEYLKVGEVVFRNIKPCTRCVFATIDYRTGKRNPDMEPLRTLRKYRPMLGNHPCLGINLGLDNRGKISVGDDVSILS